MKETRIEGKRLILEKFTQKDLERIRGWGEHKDPLFFDYNISKLSPSQMKIWYLDRRWRFTTRYFSINHEGTMVGYIGFKKINYFTKWAELGISMNPDYLEQGFGQEAIELAIKYFFEYMGMNTLYLTVNTFNHRAGHIYKKFGFKQIGVKYMKMKFEDGLPSQELLDNKKYFIYKDGDYYSKVLEMEKTLED